MNRELVSKIEGRKATIGIIGLGYVGLPLALTFAESGFQVIGIEVDGDKVKKVTSGQSYIKHIASERIQKAVASKKFRGTLDFSSAAEADALVICVPTPLDKHHSPDMSYVRDSVTKLLPYVKKGQILSLESTVYPGATEEELSARLQSQSFKVGEDVFVVFSPEREDPGNGKFHTKNIPKVVGGSTPVCMEMGVLLYKQIIDRIVPVSSTRAAEMAKLLENIYRAVNIGLVNELKTVADRMDLNIWEVIDAAATKPFGFTPFYPGPGLGGHCIPIDPFYLTWKAKEFGVHTRFIELAGQVNLAMPEWVIDKLTEALNVREKSLKGAKVMVLGVAYKKNIEDSRESPALELLKLLKRKGAVVSYSDPFISSIVVQNGKNHQMESIAADSKNLKSADCILIATDHDAFDYDLIQKTGALIVDTRGRYQKSFENVVRA